MTPEQQIYALILLRRWINALTPNEHSYLEEQTRLFLLEVSHPDTPNPKPIKPKPLDVFLERLNRKR